MATRKRTSSYQYEPLVTPENWSGDAQRFSMRLTQILDDLYAKYGTLKSSMGGGEEEEESPVEVDYGAILDRVYPVGSIYMSVNSTSPATLFGGTWVRIKDTFLLAAGDSYSGGSSGGEAKHTLTASELPKITGTFKTMEGSAGSSTASGAGVFRDASGVFSTLATSQCMYLPDIADKNTPPSGSAYQTVSMSFGGGASHNNMPPYLAVNVWKRTA